MKNKKYECFNIHEISMIELKEINGGSDTTDDINRGLGYVLYKVNKWVHSFDEYFQDTLTISY